MTLDCNQEPIQDPVCGIRRVWIIDDEPLERAWLRKALTWAANAAGWGEAYVIREAESGVAWIEAVEADAPLSARDFVIADGMIGDDPIGGATLVRTWLGNRLASESAANAPRLLMITGQGYPAMRRAFAVGTYPAVSLVKPANRQNPVFMEILAKFLAGRLDPLIGFGHQAVNVFDEAPNSFLTSLIPALGEKSPKSVALGVADGVEFARGPLAALETTLVDVFGSAWAGCLNPSIEAGLASVKHVVTVGRPGAWLPSLAEHAFQQQGATLGEANTALLQRLGTQVDYAWADLTSTVTRARSVSGRGLRADDLLPAQRWVAARTPDRGLVALTSAQRESWILSTNRDPHVFLLLLMDVARNSLCAAVDAGNPVGNGVDVHFDALMQRGAELKGEHWIVHIRNLNRRAPFTHVLPRIKEGIGDWEKLSAALAFDTVGRPDGTECLRVPVHWAFSSPYPV
jgi:hypothetical protein